MVNISVCLALDQNFSEANRQISSSRHVLFATSVIAGVIDGFIILSNVILVTALIRSSDKTEGKVTMTGSNISQRARWLMASLSAGHTVVGAFLIPAAITQIINNGTWVMGPGLCMTKNVVEAVTVAACMYHVIVMALDMYVAICKPLLYRKLTARSSHLMILLCWLVPTAVFVVPIVLVFGLHQKGKELIILCQGVFGMCSSTFSGYFIYFITFAFVLVPIAALCVMYFYILRAIAQFHNRLPKDITLGNLQRTQSTPKSKSKIFTTAYSAGMTEISHAASDDGQDIDAACRNERSDDIKRIKPPKKEVTPSEDRSSTKSSSFSNFRKSCHSTRAFRYILTVLSWYSYLMISFSIFKLVSIFRPDLTPFWLSSCMWWLGYLNSAVNPFLLCSNKNVRRCVENLICRRFFLR